MQLFDIFHSLFYTSPLIRFLMHPNWIVLKEKELAGKKWSNRKPNTFHVILDWLCFQSQNLESRRTYEVESLHVVRQSSLLCVCQLSSKMDNFQGKRASEEKSGPTKKHKIHEMLDLLGFQSQNLESRRAYEVESFASTLSITSTMCVATFIQIGHFQGEKVGEPKHTNFLRFSSYSASNLKISTQGESRELKVCMYLFNHFYYEFVNFYLNRSNFRVKGLARKGVVRLKNHEMFLYSSVN